MKFAIDNTNKFLKMANDFLSFKRNVFPVIVRFIYFVSILGCFIKGLSLIFSERGSVAAGILVIILGPIVFHLILEFLLLLFSILDVLIEIRNTLQENKK
ncbi:MAG: hypothetical protein IKC65_09650 [Lentisphaeria bacterium]|nr:hypothetical protein [Lentisphaeria bacterium]